MQQTQLILHIFLGAQAITHAGVTWDEALPIHQVDLLQKGFGLQRMNIDHAAARHLAHGDGVHHEDDFLFGQAQY